jgi:hypothetical protein
MVLIPSTAEDTEMGGVMIPSASSALPPIMAERLTIEFLFLTTYKNKDSAFTMIIGA